MQPSLKGEPGTDRAGRAYNRAMNKEAALESLGLQGNEDHATVARVYGERLAAIQERLVSAQSDADRNTHGAELARLSEAYEYVTGTGRYTNSSDASATARVAASPRPAAIASTNSAGSFFGARPLSLISTARCTTRTPSSARHSTTALAFSIVSARSPM